MPSQMVNETDAEKSVRQKDNLDWLDKNHKRFENFHKNQFVAIKDKTFVDKDIELEALVKRLGTKDFDDSIAIGVFMANKILNGTDICILMGSSFNQ